MERSCYPRQSYISQKTLNLQKVKMHSARRKSLSQTFWNKSASWEQLDLELKYAKGTGKQLGQAVCRQPVNQPSSPKQK